MGSKQKCPECEEGAPSWLVSYGDMTTLLLCFFVFLLVTAKVDVDKLNSAVGYMAFRMGLLPNNPSNHSSQKSANKDNARESERNQTQSIDEGKVFKLGGKQMFQKGEAKAAISAQLQDELLAFVEEVRGKPNILEVRGHTESNEIKGTYFEDAMDLSLARARFIANFLINQGKVKAHRIRIVGCGDHEKLSDAVFASEEKNRRVEVRVTSKFSQHNPNTNIE